MLFSIFEMNRRMYEGSGWRERRDDLCSCSSFTPLTSHCYPIVTHYHPLSQLSSVVIQKIWSPLQLLLLHPPHLPGQLVDHVQGDTEVHLGGLVKKMSSMEKEEASKFVMFRMGAEWRIGALAHWNHLALKLLLWSLKHFLQLSTFPLFNEIFNKIFNKIISFWGIWASTIFINFI